MMKQVLQPILFAALLMSPYTATAQSAEHEAVKLAMQDFILAYETGDGAYIRKRFRSDGVMIGHAAKTDKVMVVSGSEFANRFDGTIAADESQRKRTVEILDITDNAALAKVTLDYPTWDGVDYIALTKIDGEWMIISKAWSGKVKAAPKL